MNFRFTGKFIVNSNDFVLPLNCEHYEMIVSHFVFKSRILNSVILVSFYVVKHSMLVLCYLPAVYYLALGSLHYLHVIIISGRF